MGRDLSEQAQKLEFLKPRVDDYSSNRFGEAFLDDILNVLSESNDYQTFQEMDMDEDDLLVFLAEKSPQISKDFPSPEGLSLEKSHEILDQVLEKTNIPLCSLDAMTAENPAACYALAKSIERSGMSFEALGVKEFGLGLVHLNVNLPYAGGNSGEMNHHYENTDKAPVSTPTISLSNRCGWEYDEVIIHEMLHAHDALLNAVNEKRPASSILLSDIAAAGKSRKNSFSARRSIGKRGPILDAWISLAVEIDNLTSEHTLEAKVKMARAGIAERWSSMGLDKVSLLGFVSAWEDAPESPTKDKTLHKNLVSLFSGTPFAPSADFRASAIMAECKLLRELKDDPKPVFVSFTEQFDRLGSVSSQAASYGKEYFEDLAEKMARSIQSTLDTLPGSQQKDNPYEKRWLVYADQSLSPKITECWKEFFAKPCVQEAYDVLRETAPNFGNLKDRIELMRQKKEKASSVQNPEHSTKTPSLTR